MYCKITLILKTKYLNNYVSIMACFYYGYGRLQRQRRIDPKLATSYLTTRGKSFSK